MFLGINTFSVEGGLEEMYTQLYYLWNLKVSLAYYYYYETHCLEIHKEYNNRTM